MWNIFGEPMTAVKPTTCLSYKQMRSLPKCHHQEIKARLWQLHKPHNIRPKLWSNLFSCVVFVTKKKKKKRWRKNKAHNRAKLIKFKVDTRYTRRRKKESEERNVCEKACERQRGVFLPLTMPTGPLLLLGKSESPQSSDEDMHKVEELTLWGGPHCPIYWLTN